MKKIKDLIQEVKNNQEDFEFYPSTEKMVKTVFDDFTKDKKDYDKKIHGFSILDIGCGNGNVFDLFDKFITEHNKSESYIKKFGIEKSEILITNLSSDIIILGTDFEKQTLIDKKVDLIFSNPPYSRFKEWSIKILKECNCKTLYLIIPERWKEDKEIKNILKKRNIKFKILISDDFIDSEYRKSRSKIEVIRFDIESCYEDDTFRIWFEENFKINADKHSYSYNINEKKDKHTEINQLIKGKNIIECLEELYQKDLEKLLSTYKSLENIDYDLFKEMGVNLDNLRSGLKEKIIGLKNFYWQELFNNLDKITNKLTSTSRKNILNELNSQTNIDFTAGNAYALIIWVLKNANIYIDQQLKEVYFEMAEKNNIVNYKSNKKLIEDGWRYQRNKQSHFKLDYRLVFKRWSCFNRGYGMYDYPNGLYQETHDFINDISTIANNLGFDHIDNTMNFHWKPGEENIFYYGSKKQDEFMRVRAYLNGNIHCKINKEFMKKFNIEMARLNHWVKDETECSKELDIDINEVKQYFNSNKKLIMNDLKLLG